MNVLLGWAPAIFASAALATILVIAVTNIRIFPRLRAPAAFPWAPAADTPATDTPAAELPGVEVPAVDVLIPARNEAAVIGATVQHLLGQGYPRLNILLLDDQSEDGTARAALAAAGQAPNFRILRGQPLPTGWMGKNWACRQLADAATGDILIFSDADVCWHPGALQAVVDEMDRSSADLLTVWPTQTTVTWAERLAVPLMALAVLGYLPLRLAHDFYHPLAAAANGQCMAFRRAAYATIGGHAAVRTEVVEDVRLAQRIKAFGLKLRMADGNRLLGCRMYSGWEATVDGFAKNILAGHGHSVVMMLLSTLFHWVVFVWPWVWLLFGHNWAMTGWWLWPLTLVAAGVGVRAMTAHATHQRAADALLMPLSVILMTWIAAKAVWWRFRFGGAKWKGRIIRSA